MSDNRGGVLSRRCRHGKDERDSLQSVIIKVFRTCCAIMATRADLGRVPVLINEYRGGEPHE